MNELKNQKSPYLLQHKDNPVHWKSWGDQAIQEAKRKNKLIFLSIGYATCHWCHVMERESFESEAVANVLNENYVAIKVDREELPDVDQIYMDALQAMGQRGGWPLNMFLTPELLPVYGGTYFPKDVFVRTLEQIQNIWKSEPAKMKESGIQMQAFLEQQSKMYMANVDPAAFDLAFNSALTIFPQHMRGAFDNEWGGFSQAPKFPPHQQLRLLCHLSTIVSDRKVANEIVEMADLTLKKMAQGGVYDHLGGGFTRYSVDERWEIPHFEKMLYVNAQAIHNYLDHFQITRNTDSLNVVRDIVRYVERDMTSTGGGFYSAEDADSEGQEGRFYVWSYQELRSHLETSELEFLVRHFSLSMEGNFEGTTHFMIRDAEFWEPRSLPMWKVIQSKLLKVRDERVRPLLDDKQLTSWNGLMIGALARAGRVLGDQKIILLSQKAQAAVRLNLWKSGKLYRRYRDGQADFDATLDDYAFLIDGLIELYQSNASWEVLSWALELQELQNKQLEDSVGGYYFTQKDQQNLILRTKDYGDNAMPSGNGLSALNLIRLYFLTMNPKFKERARSTLSNLSPLVEKAPMAYSQSLLAYLWFQCDVFQFVSSHPLESESLAQIEAVRPLFGVIAYADTKAPYGYLMHGKSTQDKTYYLCRHGACDIPSKDLASIMLQLKSFQTGPVKAESN